MKNDDYIITAESHDRIDRALTNGIRFCLAVSFIALGFFIYVVLGKSKCY